MDKVQLAGAFHGGRLGEPLRAEAAKLLVNFSDRVFCNGRIPDGAVPVASHQPQRWLASPCSADLDAQGRRTVAEKLDSPDEWKIWAPCYVLGSLEDSRSIAF